MTPQRLHFKRGLLLIDAGVLLIGWNTWCWKSSSSYFWNNPIDQAWGKMTAGLEVDTLGLTVVVLLLFTAGLLSCFDAFFKQRIESTEQSNPAMQTDRASPHR